jgi:hypothetical protein
MVSMLEFVRHATPERLMMFFVPKKLTGSLFFPAALLIPSAVSG